MDGCAPWTGAGGSESLTNVRPSPRPFPWPIQYPLRFWQRYQWLSQSVTNPKFCNSSWVAEIQSRNEWWFYSKGLATTGFSCQVAEQGPSLIEVGCVNAFGEPAVDGREEAAWPTSADADQSVQ